MSSPEAAERMALWAIKLSKFDIQYCPQTAVKGQVVADFIAEYTQLEGKGVDELRRVIKPARRRCGCGYINPGRG